MDYLLIGHLTADLNGTDRTPGGTVSYAAPVIHAFQHQLKILTSATVTDPFLDDLRRYAEVSLIPAAQTTTFENIYTPDGRTQTVHAVAESLRYEHIPADWQDADLVHLAPLIDEVDPAIVHHFPDAITLLTPQGWMRRLDETGQVHFKRWLDCDVLRAVDIVVFSHEDIKAAPDLEAEFAQHVRHLFVTQDSAGGIYYHHGEAHLYSAVPIHEEKSVTGAGDVFAASLLSALPLLSDNIQAALDVARHLAAYTVMRSGMHNSVTPAEVNRVLAMSRETYL